MKTSAERAGPGPRPAPARLHSGARQVPRGFGPFSKRVDRSTILRLQGQAGNAAVSRLIVQRVPASSQNYPGEEAVQNRLADLEEDKDSVGADVVTAGQTDPSQAGVLKAELDTIEREILMLERLHEAGMKSTETNGRPWNRSQQDVKILIGKATTAARTEKDALAFLQAEDLRAGRLSGGDVTSALLQNPDLFRSTTLALYHRVVAEMVARKKAHEAKYLAGAESLATRPVHDVIGDYVEMKKMWGVLQREVGRTHWDVQLRPFSPLSLRQRQPGSADLVVDRLDVLVAASDIDRTVAGSATNLGNLRSPLAEWHLARSYQDIAATMSRFAAAFQANAAPGQVIGAYQGDLAADLGWAGSHEAGSTEGFLVDANGILRKRLDSWVRGLPWYERIIEGIWLYDLGGKVGSRLKSMLTVEAVVGIAGFIAFLTAIQPIPFANLVVDAVLLAIGGVELVAGIVVFATYLDSASDATTFEQLHAATEGLQGVEDVIVNLMLTLATAAVSGAFKRYSKYRERAKFDSLEDVARQPVIRDDPALRRAVKEAQQAERSAKEAKKAAAGKWSSEPGVLKSAKTKDGRHTFKVTESGRAVVCSAICDEALRRYAGELELDAKAGGTAKADLRKIRDDLEPAVARRDDIAVEKALQELVDLEETLRNRRRETLGQDPGGANRPRANEGEAGLHLEDLLKSEVRVLDKAAKDRIGKEGDFWQPHSGLTYDAMRPIGDRLNTPEEWAAFARTTVKHLYEKFRVDRTFIDLTGVSADQALRVRKMVAELARQRGTPRAPVVWLPK